MLKYSLIRRPIFIIFIFPQHALLSLKEHDSLCCVLVASKAHRPKMEKGFFVNVGTLWQRMLLQESIQLHEFKNSPGVGQFFCHSLVTVFYL